MDQPSDGEPTQDVPRPPIWQERLTGRPSATPDLANQRPLAPPPTTPDIPTPDIPTPDIPTPDITVRKPPGDSAPSAERRGPRFEQVPPVVSETVEHDSPPRWPVEPPTTGTQAGPARRRATNRSRVGLVVLAMLTLAAIAAGAFLIGRNLGGDEVAEVPVSAPATAIPAPTVEPTPIPPTPEPTPEPTPAPTEAAVNDALSLSPGTGLVGPDETEPVAAVASALSPAVVLIQNEAGQGSGIIYDESGLIMTNAHVVGTSTEVTVQLASGIKVPGQVLGADVNTDVAVVKISPDEDFGVAILAPESEVQVGQLAVAIGSPFGLEQTVTAGIVSAKGRVVGLVAMIQTDAPINPGNSGGALADRRGRVIGMNSSIRTDGSGGNIGVGFAIPADTAKLIADRIIAGESLDQGMLGITGETPQLGTPGGKVVTVSPGSGAANAGILPDDLIVGFNGVEIRSMSDLAAAVRLQLPDAVVSVDVVRGEQLLTFEVVLGTLVVEPG